MERILGEFEGGEKRVLIVLVGALHGNEMAGVKAIHEVFSELSLPGVKFHGKIVGIAGNINAIEKKKRFIDYDLNRCWKPDFIQQVQSKPSSDLANEDHELLELEALMQELAEEEYEHKILVDLHTTSADNGNFIVIPGTPSKDSIVRALRLPTIVNLDTYLPGTLLKFMHQKGFLAFAFEGGQIGSQKAVDLHTHGIWELLYNSGVIDQAHDLKQLIHYEELIESLPHNLPETVRVLHRHKIQKEDYFRMKPGFQNFQPVSKGQILAEDKKGIIKSPCNGLIFMPLYQNVGNDGFFIVESIDI